MELITVVHIVIGQPEWINDLTSEMDKYLINPYNEDRWRTYIHRHGNRKNGLGIRYPGATRGHIEVNNDMIIEKIILYSSADIYKLEIHEAVQKYIGAKLVFEGNHRES